jgi:acetyltransferase
MNVETADVPSSEIAQAITRRVTDDRTRRGALSKPVLSTWVGNDRLAAPIFEQASIPYFPTEDDAVRAFMHLVRHREALDALMATPPNVSSLFKPDVATARAVIKAALAEGRAWLDPLEISALFTAYAVPMVPTLAASDPDEAVAKAAPFLAQGLAVAVKIRSRDITHKSDIGGVMLSLATNESVRDAAAEVMARARLARPDARLEGVTIQPMMARRATRELILGLADDPTFGPVVVFGHGGTAVEVVKDKALALPPLDMNLARDLVSRTAVARLLAGYRDVPAVPADAVPLTLVKLSQVAADLPEISELDINPLMADGDGVLALDARVAIKPPRKLFPGHTRLAIRPYPAEWERQLQLANGWTVHVRPMRPEDEPAIAALFSRVSREDLRLRFFHAMKEFSHAFVARLTQLDYARAMAFVATDAATGEIIGAVRLHSDSRYETAEYAILLRSDLKGKGLGWSLMQLLIAYARSEGLKSLSGAVLRENATMLTMCRDLGFDIRSDPRDASVVLATLDLAAPRPAAPTLPLPAQKDPPPAAARP